MRDAVSSPPTDLAPGDVFAGCRVEAVAGRGGMGIVYRAVQLSLERPVALKLIASEYAADPGFRERFEREARLAAAIDHPNVIPVYAAGEEAGRLYLVVRYVRGTDLHALLRERRLLSPPRAAEIVDQVGAGLDAAHAAGLVHRDVKPANVLISDGGHVYLTDFGLSRLASSDTRLTTTGAWLGTAAYSAPEHLRGEVADARADVYALGCVLHAALTGEPPFTRATVPATMLAHLYDPPPGVSARGLPRAFDGVLARALAKDPSGRYPSAGDLGRAAVAAAAGEPITGEERSVARGPAAPVDHDADTRVEAPASEADTRVEAFDHEAATSVDAAEAQTRADAPVRPPVTDRRPGDLPPAPPAPEHAEPGYARVHGRGRRRALAAAGVALAAAGIAALTLSGGTTVKTGPLSAGEVRGAAQAFATAYQHEDASALGAVLTRDVQRVFPDGRQSGRAQVVAAYRSQFRSNRTDGYRLDALQIEPGSVGRAAGRYAVIAGGKPLISGRIAFSVVRDRATGTARIGMIAATPDA
ncbi:MAG: hypothetical protein QOE28_1301 [Solirubrobacteraceae bacterium]|nr:hypothetical protein [Solirubrobacteraceae bacterium]